MKIGAKMSRRPRRTHSAAFKGEVVLAAVRGDKTLAELAQQHDVHPNQITDWKNQLLTRAADVFGGEQATAEPAIDRGHASTDAAPGTTGEHQPRLGPSKAGARCRSCSDVPRGYGTPDYFNIGQGKQFTNATSSGLLTDQGISMSIDGKGCWRDNVFIERLWRSIKYEEVYLHAHETVSQSRTGIGWQIEFCIFCSLHCPLQAHTADVVYFNSPPQPKAVSIRPLRISQKDSGSIQTNAARSLFYSGGLLLTKRRMQESGQATIEGHAGRHHRASHCISRW